MVLDAIADIAIFIIGHFWLILQMSRGANVVVIIVVFFLYLFFVAIVTVLIMILFHVFLNVICRSSSHL